MLISIRPKGGRLSPGRLEEPRRDEFVPQIGRTREGDGHLLDFSGCISEVVAGPVERGPNLLPRDPSGVVLHVDEEPFPSLNLLHHFSCDFVLPRPFELVGGLGEPDVDRAVAKCRASRNTAVKVIRLNELKVAEGLLREVSQ